jgi:CDGSH-type Zn-finger protein
MTTPKIFAKNPVPVELEAGKTYAWCACGLSDNQPWCNGAHQGTGLSPKVFKAEETKTAYMCQCKATNNPGMCDGTHNSI